MVAGVHSSNGREKQIFRASPEIFPSRVSTWDQITFPHSSLCVVSFSVASPYILVGVIIFVIIIIPFSLRSTGQRLDVVTIRSDRPVASAEKSRDTPGKIVGMSGRRRQSARSRPEVLETRVCEMDATQ